MLDLGEVRDGLNVRLAALSDELATLHAATAELWPRLDATENERNLLAAQLADLRGQFEGVEADHAARLGVIEHQGTEITRLHAEVDQRLKEATEFWPRLDAIKTSATCSPRNWPTCAGQFEGVEADHAARLGVIEHQGTEITRLHAEVDQRLKEATEFWPRL